MTNMAYSFSLTVFLSYQSHGTSLVSVHFSHYSFLRKLQVYFVLIVFNFVSALFTVRY